MSTRRHRPFRDVAKRLRDRRQNVDNRQEASRFEDVAARDGVVPLTGEPRSVVREPPETVDDPPPPPQLEWRDVEGSLEGWRVGSRRPRGLADEVPRATLDLHGRSTDDARRAVWAFLRQRRARGETVVRVVVGKGHHSDGGFGVLRDAIGGWLASLPAARHVRAFVSASPRNGGTGAVMIQLESPGLGKDET